MSDLTSPPHCCCRPQPPYVSARCKNAYEGAYPFTQVPVVSAARRWTPTAASPALGRPEEGCPPGQQWLCLDPAPESFLADLSVLRAGEHEADPFYPVYALGSLLPSRLVMRAYRKWGFDLAAGQFYGTAATGRPVANGMGVPASVVLTGGTGGVPCDVAFVEYLGGVGSTPAACSPRAEGYFGSDQHSAQWSLPESVWWRDRHPYLDAVRCEVAYFSDAVCVTRTRTWVYTSGGNTETTVTTDYFAFYAQWTPTRTPLVEAPDPNCGPRGVFSRLTHPTLAGVYRSLTASITNSLHNPKTVTYEYSPTAYQHGCIPAAGTYTTTVVNQDDSTATYSDPLPPLDPAYGAGYFGTDSAEQWGHPAPLAAPFYAGLAGYAYPSWQSASYLHDFGDGNAAARRLGAGVYEADVVQLLTSSTRYDLGRVRLDLSEPLP